MYLNDNLTQDAENVNAGTFLKKGLEQVSKRHSRDNKFYWLTHCHILITLFLMAWKWGGGKNVKIILQLSLDFILLC